MSTSAVSYPGACRWCGVIHGPTCPTVKAIEFFPDGSVKRVEFKTAADYASAMPMPIPMGGQHYIAGFISHNNGASQ